MMATSGFLTVIECIKFIFGRGSAPDPAGWDHNVSSDPLVVFYAFMLYFAVTMKCCDPHWKSGNWSGEWPPCKHPLCRTPLKFPIGLRHGKTRMMGLPDRRKNSMIGSAVLTQYLRLWQTYIHITYTGWRHRPCYACVARVKTPFHETHFHCWQYATTVYRTI